MGKRVVLNELVISRLMADPKAVAAFGFLREAPTRARRCCGGAARTVPDYTFIKRRLAGLPDAERAVLLDLLGADQAVVVYPGDGAAVRVQIDRGGG